MELNPIKIGTVFYRFTVISNSIRRFKAGRHDYYYLCKCICGNEKEINGSRLRTGHSKSCGCLSLDSKKEKAKNKGIEKGIKPILANYKSHAKLLKKEWQLSIEEVKTLISSLCYYCDRKPSNKIKRLGGDVYYNGIDRIDSNVGYILYNCVPCCIDCNSAKGIYSFIEFIEWIKRIGDNFTKEKLESLSLRGINPT